METQIRGIILGLLIKCIINILRENMYIAEVIKEGFVGFVFFRIIVKVLAYYIFNIKISTIKIPFSF